MIAPRRDKPFYYDECNNTMYFHKNENQMFMVTEEELSIVDSGHNGVELANPSIFSSGYMGMSVGMFDPPKGLFDPFTGEIGPEKLVTLADMLLTYGFTQPNLQPPIIGISGPATSGKEILAEILSTLTYYVTVINSDRLEYINELFSLFELLVVCGNTEHSSDYPIFKSTPSFSLAQVEKFFPNAGEKDMPSILRTPLIITTTNPDFLRNRSDFERYVTTIELQAAQYHLSAKDMRELTEIIKPQYFRRYLWELPGFLMEYREMGADDVFAQPIYLRPC